MADDYLDGVSDAEVDIKAEPKSSRGWLALISDAEKAYTDYQSRADNVDKLYANLDRLANTVRDRQFQLFWANVSVLGPSIYSRPPVPVVVPRFKERSALSRITSELLERCCVVLFEVEDVDSVMRLIRDDLTILARGVPWLRYEAKSEGDNLSERVCIEHVDRKDFLHEPARKWKEVGWVGKRSWMTKQEMRKRFHKTSGDAYQEAAFERRKDENNEDDGRLTAGVWEIWSKTKDRVVWVTEGVDKLLDDDKPHLKLDGFFPCPRPAYATLQRRSLIPVPDMVFYKDQLEEINELTARIGALTESLKLRGFYPAGAGEIGDAIEAAVKTQSDNATLIPISNWAMIGNGGVKDMIVWLPLDMIATTVQQLIELRKQLIDDVYQITGLSDIMRGSTVASETLGAQELKSQYGSIRIRDRQDELTRVARDITRIAAEIMAENFSSKTLMEMSQLPVPTDADIDKHVKDLDAQGKQIGKQLEQAQKDPEIQAMAEQNPEQAQQIMQQAQEQMAQIAQQIGKLKEQPTIEKVMKGLQDQRLRPFVLDIETDSTIAPDENAQKQRATEFLTSFGGFLAQALPAVQQFPQAAPLMADMMKFTASQFRAGRELDGSIDEFADQMKQLASQPQADPNAGAAAAEAEKVKADQAVQQAKTQIDTQKLQMDAQKAQAAAALEQTKLQMQQQAAAAANELAAAKLEAERWKAQLQAKTAIEVAQIGAGTTLQQTELEASLDAQLGVQEHQQEVETLAMQQDHQIGMQAQNLDAAAVQAERDAQKETAE